MNSTDGPTPIGRSAAVAILVCVAILMATNHVAARLAFDHGVSVAAAVTARGIATAVVVLSLMLAARTAIAIDRRALLRALAVGLLITVQSYCLYSAVSRLPVALALITFNVFPLLLGLISWLAGSERPNRRTLLVMVAIGIGLTLALDLLNLQPDPTQTEIGPGVAFGLMAALLFASALFLTERWLKQMDGRMRTVLTMATVGSVTLIVGVNQDLLQWPVDSAGWLGLVLLCLLYGSGITILFATLPRLGAVNSIPVLNVEPVAAMILSWLLLGQRLTLTQIIGCLLVVSAVMALALLPARGPPTAGGPPTRAQD